MERERLERLTDQQRVCLRHVYAHKTSKEIAPLLGIEPNSVDQHIKAAMRVLGVTERRAAAFMLAEYEGVAEPRLAMREEQAEFAAASPTKAGGLGVPLPISPTKPSDLRPLQRIGWILTIMLAIALSFGVFVAGLEALSRLSSR